ncbi:hypothetical protein A28LD_0356 [Idiomarina sp. A28L]|uniref:hypothetical protein n=1 Tax=Idiomarina sp. A28L TaxID=1036674 RepID=UPI0002138A65|nr:hypothetical protein [Idiomarina sp. A28L]EGN76126.1 hypothetical protein A28LD_0356 [Idiomarina sp. A28L]
MNRELFKDIFNLDYIQDHYQLWSSGEATIGRRIPENLDFSAVQDFLATHPDSDLMLEEAQNHFDDDDPLSATATDLIFTYLDDLQTTLGQH